MGMMYLKQDKEGTPRTVIRYLKTSRNLYLHIFIFKIKVFYYHIIVFCQVSMLKKAIHWKGDYNWDLQLHIRCHLVRW